MGEKGTVTKTDRKRQIQVKSQIKATQKRTREINEIEKPKKEG